MAPNFCKNIFMNFDNTLCITKIFDSKILALYIHTHILYECIKLLFQASQEVSVEELTAVTRCKSFPYHSIRF